MFSVIVPLYNKALYVEKTLRSVFKQTYTNYELVVVDDGSTDNSAEIASKLIDEQKEKNPNFCATLIRQKNAGVATARNNAIAASHGEYFCLLDADDWWKPTFLETMHRLIVEYPNAGLYCTNYYYVHNGRNQVKLDIPTGYFNYCKEYARTLCMIATSSSSSSSRIFKELGGFNPKLKLGEDFDLWIRIALKYGTAIWNEPLVYFNNDLPAAHRATHHLHKPENHMLWNLDYLEEEEKNNPDYKQLIDNLRVYGLFNHFISKEYHEAAVQQLQKVDWSKQPKSYIRLYAKPLWYLRLRQKFLEQGVMVKRMLRNLKNKLFHKKSVEYLVCLRKKVSINRTYLYSINV